MEGSSWIIEGRKTLDGSDVPRVIQTMWTVRLKFRVWRSRRRQCFWVVSELFFLLFFVRRAADLGSGTHQKGCFCSSRVLLFDCFLCGAARGFYRRALSICGCVSWRHGWRRIARKEVMYRPVMVALASTGNIREDGETREVCTTTGFCSTNTIRVTSAKWEWDTSTRAWTSITVPLWTSTNCGRWFLKQ